MQCLYSYAVVIGLCLSNYSLYNCCEKLLVIAESVISKYHSQLECDSIGDGI